MLVERERQLGLFYHTSIKEIASTQEQALALLLRKAFREVVVAPTRSANATGLWDLSSYARYRT